MNKQKLTDEQFIELVKNNSSFAEVIRAMGLKPAGGNYDTVKKRINKLNLDISHMTGQAWNQGKRYKIINPSRPLSEILVEHSTWVSTDKLRKRLLKEGIKEHKCECCNNTEWMDKPISLELHHINGIKDDLRIENLQILCPNCHAFTDNYRGKNIKPNSQEENSTIESCKIIFKDEEIIKPKKEIILKYCENCGVLLEGKKRQNKYCSVECYRELSKGKRPSVFELIEKFKELKNFVQVGKFYNVSDNAVRKWCSFYGILDTIKNSNK